MALEILQHNYHTAIVKGKIHEILYCVMLQKIMEYLNTIKRHPGRISMKFEKDEGSFEISFCVCSIAKGFHSIFG